MRLVRRPQIYVTFACFLVFLLALADFNGTVSLSLLPSFRESPYYTEDESHSYTWETPSFFPPLKTHQKEKPVDFCKNFPTHLLDKVQIVMKTGTGELAKTKAHLDTISSCITNILIFSDLEETIGGHETIDILADLPRSYNNNEDFAAYAAQKKAHSEGKPVGYSAEGWKLDRFKFLPMVDKAYQMRPRADWYVFIEADVYYFWGTLLESYSSCISQTFTWWMNIWKAWLLWSWLSTNDDIDPIY